jgi:hypothetical protein
LRGCGDVAINSEMRDEGANLSLGHFAWMALVMKDNKAPNPLGVGLFRANAQVADARDSTNLLKQQRHLSEPNMVCKVSFLH